MTRVTDQPAIVLHVRPYRETSLIVNMLSLEHGRVALVAKGVRGGRRGRALQSFTSVRVGWTGRSGLATLTGFEVIRQHWYRGNALASAFYLTELLMRLLDERESHPRVFAALGWALETLETDPITALRSFEKLLLEDLGYGIDFDADVHGRPIEQQGHYRLVPDHGFVPAGEGFGGQALQRISAGDFTDPATRVAARTIFREALSGHLGPRPLLSRRLLVTDG
jgi:DNA repair protein RecO (recombination protein O)